VLFVGVFGGDEPVECVVRAAALRPDLDVRITGDLRRCPPKLRSVAPPNVTFVGYLGGVEYRQEVAEADVVVALTTEPTSIVRAGYEAVYARRPLVITDWSQGKEVFPRAVATANDPDALAAAFDLALTAPKRDRAELEAARTEQMRRWHEQEATLRAALGLGSSNGIDESSDTMAVLS
jgi:thiamine pyrophosphate-dependent acetolactate synthase large subunit-like protein